MQRAICRLKLLFLILICSLFQEIDLNAAESMPKTVFSPVTDACKAVAGWMYCVAHYLANRQLIKAAASGDLGKVKSAIAYGADVNCIDIFSDEYVHNRTVLEDTIGNTALLIASARGHIEIVKFLLTVPGIDVNSANEKVVYSYSDEGLNWVRKKHQTPLKCAIQRNKERFFKGWFVFATDLNFRLVKVLLGDSRIRIDLLSVLEQTDLMMAVQFRQPEIVQLLLKYPKMTPDIFHHIDSCGDNVLLRALIIDQKDKDGVVASILEHKYFTLEMLEHKNCDGWSALELFNLLFPEDEQEMRDLLLKYKRANETLALMLQNYKDGLTDDIFTESEIDLFNQS